MNRSRNIVLFSVILILGVWATAELRIYANFSPKGGIGPDVIVGDLPSVMRWGTEGGETAFSIGTTSCNIGDEQLRWIANSPFHPVISQNLYRVKDGRIEQLGQSWLKHGFFALSQSLCGNCQPTNGTALGVGCSDPYSSNLNGQQGPLPGQSGTGGLGPRSEVNATTGVFPWPPRRLTAEQRGIRGGRIRVANSDLDPTQNAGALYFIESQYVQPDDAAAGNDDNNASYRQVFVTTTNGFGLAVSGASPTVRTEPAINAWRAVHPDVELFNVDVQDDGRLVVGIRTTPNGNGFHTEIAIENLTSHQSVRSLDVDCGSGLTGNPGFNDVNYDAENYSGTDWAPVEDGSRIAWSTETFAENQDANALRWGTLYSFWFDSDNQPATLTLGLFRPGTQSEIIIKLETPEILLGDINQDGVVNLLDVSPFVALLNAGDFQIEADINEDGLVNLLDVSPFVDLLSP